MDECIYGNDHLPISMDDNLVLVKDVVKNFVARPKLLVIIGDYVVKRRILI